MLNKFQELLVYYNIEDDIRNINTYELISFTHQKQKLQIKIFPVIVDGQEAFDCETSHNLFIEGSSGPYTHSKGPRSTKEEALREAMINLFHLLQVNTLPYKWVINENF